MRTRQRMWLVVAAVLIALVALVVLAYQFDLLPTATEYLAVTNMVIGLAYYVCIGVFVWAPLKIRWLRRLGRWGAAFTGFMALFFFGCGTHHLDMVTHFATNQPLISSPHALSHFLVWDTIQPIGALGATCIALFKGRFFVEQLRGD